MTNEVRRKDEWTEPGTYEVDTGVYRIPLPLPNDGLKAVNVYAILGSESLTLIDSGWALEQAREALESALRVLGCEIGDVDRFLVTHVHRDHYTQALALRELFGIPIALGEGERPTLELLTDPEYEGLAPHFDLLRSHGASEVVDRLKAQRVGATSAKTIWEMPDIWLQDKDEIELPSRTLKVIHTPGHTQGHVVFADEAGGMLFAGDHVLPHITPSIGFEPKPGSLPLGNYLASLRLVRTLPDMRLLPAHGPVAPSVHARADEILLHHDQRLSSALNAIIDGATTAFHVAQRLPWTGRLRTFDSLDPFNQMLAVLEIAAHLDLLVVQEQLAARFVNGIHYYEVVANESGDS